MALTVRHSRPLEHSDATWVVHVTSIVSLLIGGAYWWAVLTDPFFGFPAWCGPVAGCCRVYCRAWYFCHWPCSQYPAAPAAVRASHGGVMPSHGMTPMPPELVTLCDGAI